MDKVIATVQVVVVAVAVAEVVTTSVVCVHVAVVTTMAVVVATTTIVVPPVSHVVAVCVATTTIMMQKLPMQKLPMQKLTQRLTQKQMIRWQQQPTLLRLTTNPQLILKLQHLVQMQQKQMIRRQNDVSVTNQYVVMQPTMTIRIGRRGVLLMC